MEGLARAQGAGASSLACNGAKVTGRRGGLEGRLMTIGTRHTRNKQAQSGTEKNGVTLPGRVLRAAPYTTRVTMGIDPTASSVTLLDPETGKGRITYLCEGQPARLFTPTPGLWFSNQSDEVRCCDTAARPLGRRESGAPAHEPVTRPAAATTSRHASPSPPQVFAALQAEYDREPYPSASDMERIAQKVNAPGVSQVRMRMVREYTQ